MGDPNPVDVVFYSGSRPAHEPRNPHPVIEDVPILSLTPSDTCSINMVDPKEGIKSLKGHEDSVLGVQFDPMGSFIISCGADTMWKYWG